MSIILELQHFVQTEFIFTCIWTLVVLVISKHVQTFKVWNGELQELAIAHISSCVTGPIQLNGGYTSKFHSWRVWKCFDNSLALLLVLHLVEMQITRKKRLKRKMIQRPNICYIFEKLGVQGCEIWHSHVLIPFNSAHYSAPAHSTRPHNAEIF